MREKELGNPRTASVTVGVVLCALSTACLAIDVNVTDSVKAPADRVWGVIGEFCSIQEWHPAITTCQLEKAGSDDYRILTLDDGGVVRERKDAHSDADRSYSYTITESPLPVANYGATLTVSPGGSADESMLEWRSNFDAKGASDEEAAKLIEGVYKSGFENIKKMLQAM